MEIAGASIRMQIDKGASCNVLPHIRNMCSPPGTLITETDRTLKMYSKSTLPVLGTCRVTCVTQRTAGSTMLNLLL